MENFINVKSRQIEIMVVDDAPENIRILSRILVMQKFKVISATSGVEALEMLDIYKPDLILLDVKMPDMDGFNVCRIIKENSKTVNIPIIFISGMDQMEEKTKGFQVGGSDYILKPFNVEEVILRINNLLRIAMLEEQLRAKTNRLESIIEGTNAGTYQWNLLTDEAIFNERWANIIGYTLEELSPTSLETFTKNTNQEDFEKLAAMTARVIAGELEFSNAEIRMKHKNGNWIWVESRGKITAWLPDGRPLIMSGTHQDINEKKYAYDKFHKLFDNNPSLMAVNNISDNKFTDVNIEFLNKLGYSRDEILGKTSQDLGLFSDINEQNKVTEILRETGSIKNFELQLKSKEGQKLIGLFSGEVIDNNEEKSFLTVMVDITKERENSALTKRLVEVAENYLQGDEKQLDYQSITDELINISGAKIIALNLFDKEGEKFTTEAISGESKLINKAISTFGYQIKNKKWDKDLEKERKIKDSNITKFESLKDVVGNTIPRPIIDAINKAYRVGEVYVVKMMRNEIMLGDFTIIMDKNIKIKNLDVIEIYTRLLALYLSRKIEEEQKKKIENEIKYVSFHDELTGLYNRRFFEEELIRLDNERNLPLIVIMGDVNGLKLVNDAFGHLKGDELLKKIAISLKKACRSDDIISRWGGDEFVILLPKTSEVEAEKLTRRIKDLNTFENIEGIKPSISFGIAGKYNINENMVDVIKSAEKHLYGNKLYEGASIRNEMMQLILNTLYEKNQNEMFHSNRVSELCEMIAVQMEFNDVEVSKMKMAGLMHDIGKVAIDERISNKIGELTNDEENEMKKHSEIGFRILNAVSEFNEIAQSVLEHHERWDGTGYPKGLKAENISLQARIIAVADTYDTMLGNKTYGVKYSKSGAVKELNRCAGTQFDPQIVKIFVEKVAGKL